MSKKSQEAPKSKTDAQLEKLIAGLEKLKNEQENLTNELTKKGATAEELKKEIEKSEETRKEVNTWLQKLIKGEELTEDEVTKAKTLGLDFGVAGKKAPTPEPTPEPQPTPEPKKKVESSVDKKSRKAIEEYNKKYPQELKALNDEFQAKTAEIKKIAETLKTGNLAGKKLSEYKTEVATLQTRLTEISAEIEKKREESMKFETANIAGFEDVDLDKRVAGIGANAEAIRSKDEKDRTPEEKTYLAYADAVEKEAKRRGRSAEDLAQIERLTTELKKSPIKLTEHEEKLLVRKESKENREAVLAEYNKKSDEQNILAAQIAVLKKELFDADGNRVQAKGAKKAKNDALFESYKAKTAEWNAGDTDLQALAEKVKEVNKGYVGMDTKIDDVKLRREHKDVHQDAENRERRRKLFEKKTALETAELHIAEKVRDLNAKYSQFLDKDGNLIVELKDVKPEDRTKLEEYLIERETLSAERIDAGGKRTAYETEKATLFAELKETRERNLKAQLDKSRTEYTTAYAKHYGEMNDVKKWGINALKRLGFARGEVGMPKEIKALKDNYNEAIDAELARKRLMKEGMSEEESKAVIDRFRKKFTKFEEVKSEQEKINQMRMAAFDSDKNSSTRKALNLVKYGYLLLSAGAGAMTGGATYITSRVVGMVAGAFVARQVNKVLEKKWKEEDNMKNRIAELEKDFKTGNITPSEYDKKVQEIYRLKNGAKAMKKLIVLGTAFVAGMGAREGYDILADKGLAPSFENGDDVDGEKGDGTTPEGSEGGTANPPEEDGETIITPTDPGTDGPYPFTPEKPEFTISVEVEKGQGAISMFEDLQDELEAKYLNAEGNLIDPLNTPESVAHILSVTPEELAIEHGFWDLNADAAGGNGNESALIELHATLSIDQDGQLTFENPSSDPIILEDGDSTTPIEKFDGRFGDSNGPDDAHSDVNTDDREWKIAGDDSDDDPKIDENTDTRTWTIADHKPDDYPPADSVFDKPIDNTPGTEGAPGSDGTGNASETSVEGEANIETTMATDFIHEYAGDDFSLNAEGETAFANAVDIKMDEYFGTPDASGIDNYLEEYPLLTNPDYSAQEVLDILKENPANFEGSPIFEEIQNNDWILGDMAPETGESFTHYLLNSIYEDLNDDYKYSLPSSN